MYIVNARTKAVTRILQFLMTIFSYFFGIILIYSFYWIIEVQVDLYMYYSSGCCSQINDNVKLRKGEFILTHDLG